MLTLPNYEVTEKVYESSRTVVYRGYRASDRQPVVLKTHRTEYPSAEEVARFRREYELGCQVEAPGVIELYGIEKYKRGQVLIREDFGAISGTGLTSSGGPAR